jgi:alpha-1,6-mannosyltransferase
VSSVAVDLAGHDRTWPRVAPRVAGAVALGTVVVSGVAVALAAAAADDAYLVPGLARAQAAWLSGPLAGLGLATPLRGVLVEIAVMTLAYAAAVALAPRMRLRWVAAAVVLLHGVFLLAPPLLSNDVFSYADVARLGGLYHLDPYVRPPSAERHDALYVFVHWRHTVTVYGPLFTLGARALGHLSPAAAVWAFKAIAAVAGLGCTALVGWIAHRRGRPVGRAVAAFGLNPVVLVWSVGGAHNDLLMLLALLAGVALTLGARPAMGGAMVVCAAAIKATAGLAIPFLLVGSGRRARVLVGVGGAAAAVLAATFVAFPDHAHGMVTALEREQRLVGIASVPQALAYALGLATVTAPERLVLHVLLAVWLAGLLVWVLRGGDFVAATGWALLGVIVASTWLLPWYLVWPLGFGAAAVDRRLLIAASGVALLYVIGHVPVN